MAARRSVVSHEKPTRQDLENARDKFVPDLLGPRLKLIFCGINPGLYSGAVGHHFARPGNRFWKTLHAAGMTPRLLSPYEERTLLDYGIGITNLVARTTASADELSADELCRGAGALRRKLRRLKPELLAVLGVSAHRMAFALPHAMIGEQPERIEGAVVWVLPNPSGLNAHYQLPDLVRAFSSLSRALRREGPAQD